MVACAKFLGRDPTTCTRTWPGGCVCLGRQDAVTLAREWLDLGFHASPVNVNTLARAVIDMDVELTKSVPLREACEAALAYLSGGECTPQAERDLREQIRKSLR